MFHFEYVSSCFVFQVPVAEFQISRATDLTNTEC